MAGPSPRKRRLETTVAHLLGCARRRPAPHPTTAVSASTAADGGLAVVEPAAVGMDAEALAEITRYTHAQVEAGVWPHAVTLVARRGEICLLSIAEGDGVAVDPARSLFRIYSMTKPLLAAATLALVERGDLTLDDPVGQHLPEWAESAGLGYPCLPLFTEGALRHTRLLTMSLSTL